MASYYQKAGMRCAQGMPLYWQRAWDFEYVGGVSRFRPEGLPESSLSWLMGDMTAVPHDSAATFAAPTTDGRHTWITATATGDVIGAGFNAGTADSYLRCGNPEQDGGPIGPVTTTLTCNVSGEAQSYQMGFRIDATRFPYSSVEVLVDGVSGPVRGQVVADPDGTLLSTGQVTIDSSVGSPFEARFTIVPGTNRQTTYYMQEGRLVSVDIGLAGVSITHACSLR